MVAACSCDRRRTRGPHIEATIVELMGERIMLELGCVTAVCLQSFRAFQNIVTIIIFEKGRVYTKVRVFNRSWLQRSGSNRILWWSSLPFDIWWPWSWWCFGSLLTLVLTSVMRFTIRPILIIMWGCWYHVHMRLKVPWLRPRLLLLWRIIRGLGSPIWLIYEQIRTSEWGTRPWSRACSHS